MNGKFFSPQDGEKNGLSLDEKEKTKMEKKVFYANNSDYRGDESERSDSSSEEWRESREKHKRGDRRMKNLLRMWERGEPIKLLSDPGDEAFTILFNNYKHLRYGDLSKFLSHFGDFLSVRELDGNLIRVRFKTEKEIRKCYTALKTDPSYQVSVLLDLEEYKESKRREKKVALITPLKYNILGVKDDHEGALDDDKATQKALQVEAGIRFGDPPLQPLKAKSSNCRVEKKKRVDPKIGTWNGNIVIVPEEPFVNKHLEPPLSYLKWKHERNKLTLSNNDRMSHSQDSLGNGSTDLNGIPVKSLEIREKEISSRAWDRLDNFPKDSACQSPDSSTASRCDEARDSASSVGGCDSTTQTESEKSMSQFSPLTISTSNGYQAQSIHVSSSDFPNKAHMIRKECDTSKESVTDVLTRSHGSDEEPFLYQRSPVNTSPGARTNRKKCNVSKESVSDVSIISHDEEPFAHRRSSKYTSPGDRTNRKECGVLTRSHGSDKEPFASRRSPVYTTPGAQMIRKECDVSKESANDAPTRSHGSDNKPFLFRHSPMYTTPGAHTIRTSSDVSTRSHGSGEEQFPSRRSPMYTTPGAHTIRTSSDVSTRSHGSDEEPFLSRCSPMYATPGAHTIRTSSDVSTRSHGSDEEPFLSRYSPMYTTPGAHTIRASSDVSTRSHGSDEEPFLSRRLPVYATPVARTIKKECDVSTRSHVSDEEPFLHRHSTIYTTPKAQTIRKECDVSKESANEAPTLNHGSDDKPFPYRRSPMYTSTWDRTITKACDVSTRSHVSDEEPFTSRNSPSYSTPETHHKTTYSPNSTSIYVRNNCYPKQRNLYEFSEQSTLSTSDSDAFMRFSLPSDSCRSDDEIDSTSTGREIHQYENKIKDTSKRYSNSLTGNVQSSDESFIEKAICPSDKNDISVKKSLNESIPPLVSIFNLYAVWLRKSVFEMV